MNYSWSSSVIPIAAIFSFRMLGLFMLIPVFTIFAPMLAGATPTLVGIALGSYGLSQGILQIPFGVLSDRYGRKTMITIGLLLFAFGGLLGAVTHSIYGMIIARTLQGTGAIGSVLMALLADLTPDTQRTKAMAVIGVTIGVSFSLAMVLSPAITSLFGLAGIFYLTLILAVFGLVLLHVAIPTPPTKMTRNTTTLTLLKSVILNKQLQPLNIGIFIQHLILTATFFVIPLLLQQQTKQGHLLQQWHFYLPLMVVSFLLMLPFIFFAEKKQKTQSVFVYSILATAGAQGFLAFFYPHWWLLWSLMIIYFVAFNILEASLPSLISKSADPGSKGTAMGVYSSSQFLGIFIGGLTGGLLFQYGTIGSIFIFNALISIFWVIITCSMRANHYLPVNKIRYD